MADAVESSGGKLYALGAGWNRLGAPGFPVVHPRMGIGVLLTVESGEPRSCRLELRMLGPDGRERAFGSAPDGTEQRSLGVDVQVQGSLEDVVVPMAMNLDGLGFDRPGGYAFVLSVSGVEEERLEFSVGEVQPGQPPERTTSGGYL